MTSPTIIHEVLMNTHLKPGNFIRLKDQPQDLPDFILDRYLGTFCWIRQQAWGHSVQWKVNIDRIEGVQSDSIQGACG